MEFDFTTIISLVLGLVATVFGGVWLKAKGKISQLSALVKEAYEVVGAVNGVLSYINDMLADNKIDKVEIEQLKVKIKKLKNELLDVKVAFLKLIGKQ